MFGAIHRTGHPGAMQDALSTHLAVKNRSLSNPFNGCDQRFEATPRFQPPFERVQEALGVIVNDFQEMRISLQPVKHDVFLYLSEEFKG